MFYLSRCKLFRGTSTQPSDFLMLDFTVQRLSAANLIKDPSRWEFDSETQTVGHRNGIRRRWKGLESESSPVARNRTELETPCSFKVNASIESRRQVEERVRVKEGDREKETERRRQRGGDRRKEKGERRKEKRERRSRHGTGHAQIPATTMPDCGATSPWPDREISRFAMLWKTSMPSFHGFPGWSFTGCVGFLRGC